MTRLYNILKRSRKDRFSEDRRGFALDPSNFQSLQYTLSSWFYPTEIAPLLRNRVTSLPKTRSSFPQPFASEICIINSDNKVVRLLLVFGWGCRLPSQFSSSPLASVEAGVPSIGSRSLAERVRQKLRLLASTTRGFVSAVIVCVSFEKGARQSVARITHTGTLLRPPCRKRDSESAALDKNVIPYCTGAPPNGAPKFLATRQWLTAQDFLNAPFP